MNHILSNLPEYELDDGIDMLNIKIIWYELSAKYNGINAWSNQTEGKELDKALYMHQIKGMCYNCGKYWGKIRGCIERREKKYCTYCKKCGHIVEECYIKNNYVQEWTFCDKKVHDEKVCW